MRQLSGLDAMFLAMENDRTPAHVSSLGLFDPVTVSGRPLDAALVRELVTGRMHLLPTFRWRLACVPFALDHPYWVDDGSFDVEYHVRDVALPAPGDQKQLAEEVAELVSRRLDRARPLWEIHVIQGLADGAVAVLTKMHHAAVDGVSGAEVLGGLLDDTAAGRESSQRPRLAPSASRPRWKCWAAVWWGCGVSRCAPCGPRPPCCLISTKYPRCATCRVSRRSRAAAG